MRQVAANHRNKHLIKICLAAWRMDTFAEKRKKLDYNWQNKMEHVTNNIISQYEAELAKVEISGSLVTFSSSDNSWLWPRVKSNLLMENE